MDVRQKTFAHYVCVQSVCVRVYVFYVCVVCAHRVWCGLVCVCVGGCLCVGVGVWVCGCVCMCVYVFRVRVCVCVCARLCTQRIYLLLLGDWNK